MPMTTAKSSGTRMVETRKARPRICSRYSRRATRTMLRICLTSHRLDEDFFKRWFNQLKTINRGHGGGFMQKLLRIAVGMHANLRMAGVVIGRLDLGALKERSIAFELN